MTRPSQLSAAISQRPHHTQRRRSSSGGGCSATARGPSPAPVRRVGLERGPAARRRRSRRRARPPRPRRPTYDATVSGVRVVLRRPAPAARRTRATRPAAGRPCAARTGCGCRGPATAAPRSAGPPARPGRASAMWTASRTPQITVQRGDQPAPARRSRGRPRRPGWCTATATKPSPQATSMIAVLAGGHADRERDQHHDERGAEGEREVEQDRAEVRHPSSPGARTRRPAIAAGAVEPSGRTARIWSTPMRRSSNASAPPTR